MTTPTKDPVREALRKITERRCCQCKETKPVSEFGLVKSDPTGFAKQCRACRKIRDAAKRETEASRQNRILRDRARVTEPKKLKAKNAIQGAVRRGRIAPWPVCAVPECDVSKVEAHHPDYDQGLDVIWLCRSHHRLAHNYIRRHPAMTMPKEKSMSDTTKSVALPVQSAEPVENDWRLAIDEALIANGLDCTSDEEPAVKALARLVKQEVAIAIDPAINPPTSSPASAGEWQPISTAPEGVLCIVGWLDHEDAEYPERHNFDILEEGVWTEYFNEHEHYLIAGVARGRSEDAPYTHWMPMQPLPRALSTPPSTKGGEHA